MALSPTGTRTIAGLPARCDRADAAHHRNGVVQPVLHVEGDAIEAAAGADLGDQRFRPDVPAGDQACARSQAFGEAWSGHAVGRLSSALRSGRSPSASVRPSSGESDDRTAATPAASKSRRILRKTSSSPAFLEIGRDDRPWRRLRASAPVLPRSPAAHRPSSLFRRAFALNWSSCVVRELGLEGVLALVERRHCELPLPQLQARTLHIARSEPKSTLAPTSGRTGCLGSLGTIIVQARPIE